MTIVYVVTSGTYSDFGIEAIYSTEADAIELATKLDALGEDGRYFEYKVDEISPKSVKGAYLVVVDMEGNVTYTNYRRRNDDEEPVVMQTPTTVFYGYGKTEEHARRSAEQLRREFLASGMTVKQWREVHYGWH